MKYPSAIPRTGQPHFPEASRQRSLRDTDSIPQSHKKHDVNTFQLGAAMRQMAEISRQLMRMRLKKPIQQANGSAATTYQITSLVVLTDSTPADFFLVKQWDGKNLSGAEIKIAKRIDFRPSYTTEIVDGTPITHTFSDDNHRTSSDGVNMQDEVCWPRFVVGAEIQAASCTNNTPVTDSLDPAHLNKGKPLNWIDLTERVWLATD